LSHERLSHFGRLRPQRLPWTPIMATKFSSQLHRISVQWPADPFRPHLQLKTFLESLSKHPNLTPETVDAARSLQNNATYKKYKLSQKMLKPASVPLHYDRLVEAFEKSARGVGRPWWKIFFGIW